MMRNDTPTLQEWTTPSEVNREPLNFEPKKYLDELSEFDMNEQQKLDLLHSLWAIMKGFVDLGVDVGSIDICGSIFETFNEQAEGDCNPINSSSGTKLETDASAGKDTA